MNINLGILSTYRKELMGIATVLVIMHHIAGIGVHFPALVNRVLDLSLGSTAFLFISGYGISYSLSTRKKDANIAPWYKKRYIRILVPYFLIIAPVWIFRTWNNEEGIMYLLYHISTASYWMEHEGAWFVALLIPLYLISPWLYKLLSPENKRRTLYCACGILLLMCLSLLAKYHIVERPHLGYNLVSTFSKCSSFLLGMCCAPYIMSKKETKWWVIAGLLVLYAVARFAGISGYAWLLVLPACLGMCLIAKIPFVNKIWGFLGKISLESYLFNVAIISLCNNELSSTCDSIGNIVVVGIAIVTAGTLLSYIAHLIAERIIKVIPLG